MGGFALFPLFCPSCLDPALGGQRQIFTGVCPIVGSRGSLLLWILLPSQWIPKEPSCSAWMHLDPHFNPLISDHPPGSLSRLSDPDSPRQLKVPWPQNMYCFVPSFKTLCFHQLLVAYLPTSKCDRPTRNSSKSTIRRGLQSLRDNLASLRISLPWNFPATNNAAGISFNQKLNGGGS